MKDWLIRQINAWADANHVLNPQSSVVAGVSGGADSVCLLHALSVLRNVRLFSIFAVHINHMLRGSESDADEKFVRELCVFLDIPLFVFREDVAAFSVQTGRSVEEAGRIIRYKSFQRVLTEKGAQYIAVAHHSQDQAETVFLNLLRGSGVDGLCGMDDVRGTIVRPLLSVSKEDIEEYIRRNGLKYRIDASNLDNAYVRNSLRNVIFPQIQSLTGFQVMPPLLRTARILKADRDYLRKESENHYHMAVISESEKLIILKRAEINRMHAAMSGRVVRIAWEKVTGSIKSLELKHVDEVLALALKKGSGKTVDLPHGVRVTIEYDRLIVSAPGMDEKAGPFYIPAQPPCDIALPGGGMRVKLRLLAMDKYSNEYEKIREAGEGSLTRLFDYDRIEKGINIRSRLPGDVFYPRRSPGAKKLKDFFIDEKIPRQKREEIPLLADGKNIIWVIGLRTAENYKITEATEKILLAEAVILG